VANAESLEFDNPSPDFDNLNVDHPDRQETSLAEPWPFLYGGGYDVCVVPDETAIAKAEAARPSTFTKKEVADGYRSGRVDGTARKRRIHLAATAALEAEVLLVELETSEAGTVLNLEAVAALKGK
jgi:hypothetical protein